MQELTLGIIKPDAFAAGQAGRILCMAQEAGFRLAGLRMLHLERRAAEGFYAVHRDKPFFGRLVEFMTSGPIVVMVLESDDAIHRWRELMGPTDPAAAQEGTVRRAFGTNVTRNAVHGSDCPANAAAEISYFFSNLELNEANGPWA